MASVPVWRGRDGRLAPEDRARVDEAISASETIGAVIAGVEAARDAAAGFAGEAAEQVNAAAAQVTLATEQASLAADQVGAAEEQVTLAAAQVNATTEQAAAASAAAAATATDRVAAETSAAAASQTRAEAAALVDTIVPVPSGAMLLIGFDDPIPAGWYSFRTFDAGDVTFRIIASISGVLDLEIISASVVTPTAPQVGDNVTLTTGTFRGAASVSGLLMQGATNRTGEINDGQWSPGVSGSFTWTVTARGRLGDTITAPVVSGEVIAAPVSLVPADFYVYADHTDATQATGADINTLPTRGTASRTFGLIGNSTTPLPIKEADAIRTRNGRYFAAEIANIPSGDGVILVVEFTVRTVSGTNQAISIAEGSNQIAALRTSGANLQPYIGTVPTGTAQNLAAGTAAVGQRLTMAVEIDRTAGRARFWNNGAGVVTTVPLGTANQLAATRILIGQNADMSIHKVRVVVRAVNQPWATTLEEVLSDFGLAGSEGGTQPLPPPDPEPGPLDLTAIRFYTADGQSLEQGANIGTSYAPNGPRWRDVMNSDRVRMLTGTVRTDGVVVTHIASPTLGGYNRTIDPTGDAPAFAATSVTMGLLTAFALTDDYLPVSTGVAYQFHSASGMSVNNLDSNPNEGTTTVPWENAVFWMEKAAQFYLANGFSVTCPGYGYNQGEADVGRDRGWWLQRFTALVTERFAQIRASTGQASDPILYLNQTGSYMFKPESSPYGPVFDQIDAVRNLGGILAVVSYALPIDNTDGRGVHLTVEGYANGGYTRAWAIEETEQGRDWNLLPPVTVTRVGDTITIPISVRGDETLTTQPGKYASFGGDPEHLGLTVIGGGTIMNAFVSGGEIVVQVSGNVTAIRYAMQRTGVDYATFTDINNVGYATHRGLIRTTLTKEVVARGNMPLTLQRWVPSFEVLVS